MTLDGGAALLQRVARMAERVHYTSAQEKLVKWLTKIPRPELSTPAPQSPWKIHVAQQERTRAVNRWAGVGSDAGGQASASGTVLMIKDAQPKELSGDAPDSGGDKDKGGQASAPDEGTPPPSVKRGRVAAWRASDARKAAAAARSSLAQKAKTRRVASAPPRSPVRRKNARRSSGAKSARAAKTNRQQQSKEEQKDRAKRKQLQQLKELESTLAELASEVDDILH